MDHLCKQRFPLGKSRTNCLDLLAYNNVGSPPRWMLWRTHLHEDEESIGERRQCVEKIMTWKNEPHSIQPAQVIITNLSTQTVGCIIVYLRLIFKKTHCMSSMLLKAKYNTHNVKSLVHTKVLKLKFFFANYSFKTMHFPTIPQNCFYSSLKAFNK